MSVQKLLTCFVVNVNAALQRSEKAEKLIMVGVSATAILAITQRCVVGQGEHPNQPKLAD